MLSHLNSTRSFEQALAHFSLLYNGLEDSSTAFSKNIHTCQPVTSARRESKLLVIAKKIPDSSQKGFAFACCCEKDTHRHAKGIRFYLLLQKRYPTASKRDSILLLITKKIPSDLQKGFDFTAYCEKDTRRLIKGIRFCLLSRKRYPSTSERDSIFLVIAKYIHIKTAPHKLLRGTPLFSYRLILLSCLLIFVSYPYLFLTA